jgi:DnaT-like ssDNA binding protein
MALDATVGGAAANSYLSQSAASAFFVGRLDADEWAAASLADQEAALIMATLRLDCEYYRGIRVTITQRLQWPRYSTYDRDGLLLDSTLIPVMIQQATCELALALLKEPTLFGDTGLEAFLNVKLGDLDITPRGIQAAKLPAIVRQLISPVRRGGQSTVISRA